MIKKTGIIKSGEYKGWTISIDDDTDGDTGGFYIKIYTGYDEWYENEGGMRNAIEDYDIEWIK